MFPFAYFCCQDVKICHKENIAKMFPFHLISVAKKRNFVTKKNIAKMFSFRLFLLPRSENLSQRKHPQNENVPIHLFLLPRSENLSQRKHRQIVPISLIFVAKKRKFVTKKTSPKCSHFAYFCCQEGKICHKENITKMFPFCLFLCCQDVKICHKENITEMFPFAYFSVAKM
jgi:hypothetical protein